MEKFNPIAGGKERRIKTKMELTKEVIERELGMQVDVSGTKIILSSPKHVELGTATFEFNTDYGDILFGQTTGCFLSPSITRQLRKVLKMVLN